MVRPAGPIAQRVSINGCTWGGSAIKQDIVAARGLRLDTLFLAMPISWKGTLQQYVGRLHRLYENKKEVQVYDYADVRVPPLARMYRKRLVGYRALGYKIIDIVGALMERSANTNAEP
jgi:hypothetical protein